MARSETEAQCLCPLRNGDGCASHAVARAPGLAAADGGDGDGDATARPSRRKKRSTTSFYDGGNAQECIASCRQSFLRRYLPSATAAAAAAADAADAAAADDSSSLTPLCSRLSAAGVHDDLWQLYWCDSAFCGVWIEPGQLGQDPNVDLLINECQSIGFPSVRDPGPPPASYSCSSLLAAPSSAADAPSVTMSVPPKMTTADTASTLTPSPPRRTSGSGVLTPTAAAITSTSGNGDSNNKGSDDAFDQSGPSPGVKAAIVVSVFLGFLLAAVLVFFCIHRRRFRRGECPTSEGGMGRGGPGDARRDDRGPRRLRTTRLLWRPSRRVGLSRPLAHHSDIGSARQQQRWYAGSDAPTPLISPASSCRSALAPGGDLSTTTAAASAPGAPRGRPILPAAWRWTSRRRSTSPPLTSLSPPPSPSAGSAARGSVFAPYYFPSSPICAPTTNKLEPRRERARTTAAPATHARVAAGATKDAGGRPPPSPVRPPRPHEAPLTIPGLVMPDRPPPPPSSWSSPPASPALSDLLPQPPPPPPPLPAAAGPPPRRALPCLPPTGVGPSPPSLAFSYPGRRPAQAAHAGAGRDRRRPPPPPPLQSPGVGTKTPTASVSSSVSSAAASSRSSSSNTAASAADTESTAVTSRTSGPSSPGRSGGGGAVRPVVYSISSDSALSSARTIRPGGQGGGQGRRDDAEDEDEDGSVTPTPTPTMPARQRVAREADEAEEALFGRRRGAVSDEDIF